jgi:predicted enzyme related to lactoylglutathione lyase
MNDTLQTITPTTITGVALVAVYVDDFAKAFSFYRDILGLEQKFAMGSDAYYFNVGDRVGLYLEGGNAPAEVGEKTARSSFVLRVESVGAMFEKLAGACVRLVHKEPVNMGGDNFWFQFHDPCGNILEIVGGK